MTKEQIEAIERKLTHAAKSIDRAESRQEKYETAGDVERASKAEKRADRFYAEISAMQEVLNILGFRVVWSGDDGSKATLTTMQRF